MITNIRIVGSDTTEDLQKEAERLLNKLIADVQSGGFSLNHIIQINFFVSDEVHFSDARKLILETIHGTLGDNAPAINIIAQTPLTKARLILEYIIPDNAETGYSIQHKKVDAGIYYSVLSADNFKMIFAAGLTDISSNNPVRQIEQAFTYMNSILTSEGMNFGHVIRQWNYLESITKSGIIEGSERQPYQVLNDIRSTWYKKSNFQYGYPAATGIGMHSGGFVLEFNALDGNSGLQIFPLQNPLQVNAYQYSQNMLVGSSLNNGCTKSPPLFERAKVVSFSDKPVIYISGTAAIHNEKSMAPGDAGEQTRITLGNIDKLISQISDTQDIEPDGKDIRFTYARVYIKNRSDYSVVKSICDEYFKNAGILYLVSDVCREELLVEIEGMAIV